MLVSCLTKADAKGGDQRLIYRMTFVLAALTNLINPLPRALYSSAYKNATIPDTNSLQLYTVINKPRTGYGEALGVLTSSVRVKELDNPQPEESRFGLTTEACQR